MFCGPPNDSKWSAHQKNVGTTELVVGQIPELGPHAARQRNVCGPQTH